MSSHVRVFQAMATLSIVASILPFFWHLKTRNIPALILICWIVITNIFVLINAIVWSDFDIFSAWEGRIYCDIQVKFFVASASGKMGCLAAVSRNLANIMRDDVPVTVTKSERRKALAIDLAFCLLCPAWMMVAHYIVQPNRYWLFPVMGCVPSVDNSWPSIVLVFICPPIMATIASYYAAVVLVRLRRHRREFEQLLTVNSSQTTKSRFYRLYVYTVIVILILLPTIYYVLYRNVSQPRIPYDWDAIHDPAAWALIPKVPTNGNVTFDRWVGIATGFLLFLFFGLGRDALGMYKSWADTLGLSKQWDKMSSRKAKEGSKPDELVKRAVDMEAFAVS